MCRLVKKYRQKKHTNVLDRLILTDRNKEREFPRWASVLLILIETADSWGGDGGCGQGFAVGGDEASTGDH